MKNGNKAIVKALCDVLWGYGYDSDNIDLYVNKRKNTVNVHYHSASNSFALKENIPVKDVSEGNISNICSEFDIGYVYE